MFDFGGGPVAMRPQRRRWFPRWWDRHLQTWVYALYMQLPQGRLNRTRDLRLVHQAILASGRARWLGDNAPVTPSAPLPTDMERAVARVRSLVDRTAQSTSKLPRLLDLQFRRTVAHAEQR